MGTRLRVVVLSIFVFFQSFAGLDSNLSRCTDRNIMELVSNSSGKILSSTYKETVKEPYYIPNKKKIIFKTASHAFRTKYGMIYLFDLSNNNIFLNALEFDTLSIKGDISKVHSIGLADKIYFEKEDHLKLPLKNNIVLKTLYKKIDLSRLKYFVVITSLKNSPVQLIQFTKNMTREIMTKHTLGVWAWNPENIESKRLVDHNISQLYIQVKEGFEDAMNIVETSKVHTVYGLNGSPEDIFSSEHLKKDIVKLFKFKKKYPFIQGYQVDIEPYLLPNFSENKTEILKEYLAVIEELKNFAHKYGLKFSVVIPFWFDHLYINNTNIGFKVLDIADNVVLMSYRSDLQKIFKISATLLNYAKFTHKKVRIGLEYMKIEDEVHALFKIDNMLDLCANQNMSTFSNVKKHKVRKYTVFGKDISFWQQEEKLKNINHYPVSFSAFNGFVLHHYDVLPF